MRYRCILAIASEGKRKETKMTPTNTKYRYEHANECTTTVQGETYTVWNNYMRRGTFAKNEAGEVKTIKSNGYISNDLNVRKAIANRFNIKSFRK